MPKVITSKDADKILHEAYNKVSTEDGMQDVEVDYNGETFLLEIDVSMGRMISSETYDREAEYEDDKMTVHQVWYIEDDGEGIHPQEYLFTPKA